MLGEKEIIESNATIGKKIKELRKLKGISQKKIADALKCTVQYISLLETGEREIPKNRLSELAEALGVEVSDLLLEAQDNQSEKELQ